MILDKNLSKPIIWDRPKHFKNLLGFYHSFNIIWWNYLGMSHIFYRFFALWYHIVSFSSYNFRLFVLSMNINYNKNYFWDIQIWGVRPALCRVHQWGWKFTLLLLVGLTIKIMIMIVHDNNKDPDLDPRWWQ